MHCRRRQFLYLAAGAAVLPVLPRLAGAQAYPSRPVTMIVPVPAGGAMDAVARIVAEGMKASLGQPVVVENVTGASGSRANASGPAFLSLMSSLLQAVSKPGSPGSQCRQRRAQ